MVDTYIVDMNGVSADAASTTVPADRNFRGAWVLNGTVISEDIDAAKEIFKAKIREVRKPLLDAEDVIFMKALEAGDTDAQAASITRKTDLRDAPASSAIESAATIEALKAAWDTDVLGVSPY